MRFFGPILLALLAACSPQTPQLDVSQAETFVFSRLVIVKAGQGEPPPPPYVEERFYPVACITGQKETPEERAKMLMEMVPQLAGQVSLPISESINQERDMRAINKIAVPRLGCQVDRYRSHIVAIGLRPTLETAFRIKAIDELLRRR